MPLRIMTFNLLYDSARSRAGLWSERLPLCLGIIRSRTPDIAGLQEVTPRQVRDLELELPEYRILPGPPSDGGRPLLRRLTPPEHCAILVRRGRAEALGEDAFWISHWPDRPGSLMPGAWLPRIAHYATVRLAGGGDLVFCCVHACMTPWTWRTSLRILRERLDRERTAAPQIVLGDFNVPPFSRAWNRLLLGDTGFHDSWLDAAERAGPDATHHGGYGRPRWPGRIDRILVRPPVRVVAAETVTDHCGTTYPSDHYPLVATLDLSA